MTELTALIRTDRQITEELAEYLVQYRRLTLRDLKPFLDRVQWRGHIPAA